MHYFLFCAALWSGKPLCVIKVSHAFALKQDLGTRSASAVGWAGLANPITWHIFGPAHQDPGIAILGSG